MDLIVCSNLNLVLYYQNIDLGVGDVIRAHYLGLLIVILLICKLKLARNNFYYRVILFLLLLKILDICCSTYDR